MSQLPIQNHPSIPTPSTPKSDYGYIPLQLMNYWCKAE